MIQLEPLAPPREPTLFSPVLHLLPTRVRIQQEVVRLTQDGVPALVAPRLMTFPMLVDQLYREVAQPRAVLSPLARTVLADEVVSQYTSVPGRYFEAQAQFRGFTASFLAWVDAMRRALVGADAYEETVLKALPLGTDPRQVAELADLYRRYEARLEKSGLVDGPAMEREVLRLLESRQEIAALQGLRELRMEDIYDLSFLQFRMVLALTHRAQQARVFFPYNPERPDAYRFVGEHTVKYFELLGEERVASAIDPCFKFRELRQQTALSWVLEHVFKPAEARQTLTRRAADETLAVLAAPGLSREVEAIGRDIRRLLSQGVAPDCIGVVFRNLGPYGKLVEDVFTRYRIPFSFRRGSPLLANPVASIALTTVELAMSMDDLERDRVVQFVSSAYVTLPGAAPRQFDQHTAAADIRRGSIFHWKQALRRLKHESEPTLEALEALLLPLRDPRPLPEFTHAMRHALYATLQLRRNVQATREAAVLARDLEALEQLEEVLRDLDDAARMLELNRAFTLEAFHRLLLRGLEAASLPGHSAHRGGVMILNALDARGLAFDHLYLGGLSEGQWPQAPVSNPLFTDAEKALFRDLSGRRMFRSSRMDAWEDPLLFCMTLASARQRAVLSYPTADTRGQATLKSYFLEEVLELVAVAPDEVPPEQIVAPLDRAADPWEVAVALLAPGVPAAELPPLDFGASYPLLPGANARPLLPPLPALVRSARLEVRRDRFFRMADETRRADLAFDGVGRLSRFEGEAWRQFSATDLELLANCPFAWFMKRVLHLKPVQLPQVEPALNVVGSVAHEILCELYQQQPPLGDADRSIPLLETVADAVFRKWEQGSEPLGDAFFWGLKKAEILTGLKRVLRDVAERWDDERMWTPRFFEHAFGPHPVEVPGVGTVHLRGQIDRVDVRPGGFRVLDYKWSKNKEKLDEIRKPESVGMTKFQLLIYVHVMSELLGVPEGHGAIFLLRDALLDSRPFAAQPLGEILRPQVERVMQGAF
ncbi:MAG: PD-(D/E)XK nuclease family protein, partial [Candidatus Xenobia bacterium]